MTATIKQIFDTAIQAWIQSDPRWKKGVLEYMENLKQEYSKLPDSEKDYFDGEQLENPYHDSTIYFGKTSLKVKKVIVGIDVEWPEFLLVNELNKTSSQPIDLVIWHHPEWSALLWIAKLQKWVAPFVANNTGVPINVCEKIEFPRVLEVEQRFSPLNHHRAIPFAKMLDIPYLWIHTPADNCVHTYLEKLVKENEKEIERLQDIIDLLMKEPEMQHAKKHGSWPAIWNGEKESRCWKIVVTGITGGTESSKSIYAEYEKAWVGTILEMHMSADHLEAAKKHNLNVIMTDHMASDSLGMNLILDKIEKMGVEILDFSGFTRFSRN